METSLKPKERLRLIKHLNALPQTQFEEVVFALNPPNGLISAAAGAQGNRAKELLDWAEGPTGPSIDSVLELLADYVPLATIRAAPPAPTDAILPSALPTANAARAAQRSSAASDKLILEEPEGLVPLHSPFYVERPPLKPIAMMPLNVPGP